MVDFVNITIIGNGAIGIHIAGQLANINNHHVILAGRKSGVGQEQTTPTLSESMQKIFLKKGVKLTFDFNNSGSSFIQFSNRFELRPLQEIKTPQDLVIVAIKTHQINAELGQDIRQIIDSDTPVVICANGIPSWFKIGNDLKTLPAMSEFFSIVELNHIVHAVPFVLNTVYENERHNVHIISPNFHFRLGEPFGQLESKRIDSVVGTLKAAGFEKTFQCKTDIRNTVLLKLISNIANIPTAIFNNSLAGVMQEGTLPRQIIETAAHELELVAKKTGYPVKSGDIQKQLTAISHLDFTPSTARDINKARPQTPYNNLYALPSLTEKDALIGALIELAEGKNVPTLQALYTLINRLEEQVYFDYKGLKQFRAGVLEKATNLETFQATNWSDIELQHAKHNRNYAGSMSVCSGR